MVRDYVDIYKNLPRNHSLKYEEKKSLKNVTTEKINLVSKGLFSYKPINTMVQPGAVM